MMYVAAIWGMLASTAAMPATDTAPAAATPAPRSETVRYCIVAEPMTGSRIPIKTCKVRADWLRDGIDPLTLPHK